MLCQHLAVLLVMTSPSCSENTVCSTPNYLIVLSGVGHDYQIFTTNKRGFPLSQVNSNGLLSFLTEIPSFFNIQFPLDYPVIAPLYTNVDTRGSGTVYYSTLKKAFDSVQTDYGLVVQTNSSEEVVDSGPALNALGHDKGPYSTVDCSRETQDPSLLERASDAVRESFSSAADFTATSLFIATWDNVGYYNRGSDK
ncbi:unnamed protein product, partial [Timema podura]|nr:unnamed protein product [Timema podura]